MAVRHDRRELETTEEDVDEGSYGNTDAFASDTSGMASSSTPTRPRHRAPACAASRRGDCHTVDESRWSVWPAGYERVRLRRVGLARSLAWGFPGAKLVGDRLLGAGDYPPAFALPVTLEDFGRASDAFDRHRDHPLSFTDAPTVALMDVRAIDRLLPSDDDFDGIVDRLEPGER